MQGAGGIGGLVFTRFSGDASLSSAPFYDGNGNVLGLLGTDGSTVTARYEYAPFGEPLAKTGPAADLNPFRWSTKFTDETGLVDYGYRWLDVLLGRWLSKDPIEEAGFTYLKQVRASGGTNSDLGSLIFCANRPVGEVDYLGLSTYITTARGLRVEVTVFVMTKNMRGGKKWGEAVDITFGSGVVKKCTDTRLVFRLRPVTSDTSRMDPDDSPYVHLWVGSSYDRQGKLWSNFGYNADDGGVYSIIHAISSENSDWKVGDKWSATAKIGGELKFEQKGQIYP